VKACKIFDVLEPLSVREIYDSLHGYTQLWEEDLDGRSVTVGFRIADVEMGEDTVWGTAEESWIRSVPFRDEEVRVPVSISVGFTFIREGRREFLIIYAGKRVADRLAATFSELLFDRRDMVVEVYIPPEKMREIYMDAQELRSVILDDVRLAGLKKVSLMGDDLRNSRTLKRYLKNGREVYVVYRDSLGVFGLSRMGLLVAFSRIAEEDLEAYIREKILPRTEPPEE